MEKEILAEGIFTNFFIKIGAADIWNRYQKEYTRYLKTRKQCLTQPSKYKERECILVVDLKILMLKIKSLKQAASFCKNAKDPTKCRQKIAKIISRTNDQMQAKRNALVKLHRKMDEKEVKEREEFQKTSKTKGIINASR